MHSPVVALIKMKKNEGMAFGAEEGGGWRRENLYRMGSLRLFVANPPVPFR